MGHSGPLVLGTTHIVGIASLRRNSKRETLGRPRRCEFRFSGTCPIRNALLDLCNRYLNRRAPSPLNAEYTSDGARIPNVI